jgi:hypothetical protein
VIWECALGLAGEVEELQGAGQGCGPAFDPWLPVDVLQVRLDDEGADVEVRGICLFVFLWATASKISDSRSVSPRSRRDAFEGDVPTLRPGLADASRAFTENPKNTSSAACIKVLH